MNVADRIAGHPGNRMRLQSRPRQHRAMCYVNLLWKVLLMLFCPHSDLGSLIVEHTRPAYRPYGGLLSRCLSSSSVHSGAGKMHRSMDGFHDSLDQMRRLCYGVERCRWQKLSCSLRCACNEEPQAGVTLCICWFCQWNLPAYKLADKGKKKNHVPHT